MSAIPLVASADELSAAIEYGQKHTTSRWFIASRAAVFGRESDIPADWNVPLADVPVLAAVKQYSEGEREDLAKTGVAMPDGSYPIPDKVHLEAALADYYRTGEDSAVKKHIIARAVALNSTDTLPNEWVDPDHDGDNDLTAEGDTDHDDAGYRKKLGLAAAVEEMLADPDLDIADLPSVLAAMADYADSMDDEDDDSEDDDALIAAIDFAALVASDYYTDYGTEDAYDDFELDSELPVTAAGLVPIMAAFTAEQRQSYAKQKVALPDGSFPIPNKRFLKKALRAQGRSKHSTATVRRHIKKRAIALGATDLLPDSFKGVTAASLVAAGRHRAAEVGGGPHEGGFPSGGLARTAKHAAGGFEEALHPRGRDGKFITKGGRVIIHHDSGSNVEGTVQRVGSDGIEVKTDAGAIEHVQANKLSNAPTAQAHLGGAPHESPSTASEHLANVQHHINVADSHLTKAGSAETPAAMRAHTEAAAKHRDLASGHRKAATAMMQAHGTSAPAKAKPAKPISKRFITRERINQPGVHDVYDTHKGEQIVHSNGRNRAYAHRDMLNRAEDAKTGRSTDLIPNATTPAAKAINDQTHHNASMTSREHVNAAIEHNDKAREAMKSGDLERANQQVALAHHHNQQAMSKASADDLAKLREKGGQNLVDEEIRSRLAAKPAMSAEELARKEQQIHTLMNVRRHQTGQRAAATQRKAEALGREVSEAKKAQEAAKPASAVTYTHIIDGSKTTRTPAQQHNDAKTAFNKGGGLDPERKMRAMNDDRLAHYAAITDENNADHVFGPYARKEQARRAGSGAEKLAQAAQDRHVRVSNANVAKDEAAARKAAPEGKVPVYNVHTGKVEHVSPSEATAGHVRYGQSLGAGTPAAGQTVKNALDNHRETSIANAEKMFGTDRSKWTPGQLREAASLGDTKAMREITKRKAPPKVNRNTNNGLGSNKSAEAARIAERDRDKPKFGEASNIRHLGKA